jgi:hypothetical protein
MEILPTIEPNIAPYQPKSKAAKVSAAITAFGSGVAKGYIAPLFILGVLTICLIVLFSKMPIGQKIGIIIAVVLGAFIYALKDLS